jgi:hypothetical protein
MEDYKFCTIFLVNNKLVTAVLCFGSHICNQPPGLGLKHCSFSAWKILTDKATQKEGFQLQYEADPSLYTRANLL